jgi:hypothetical protein
VNDNKGSELIIIVVLVAGIFLAIAWGTVAFGDEDDPQLSPGGFGSQRGGLTQYSNNDVNRDGRVDHEDALLFLERYEAGKTNDLTIVFSIFEEQEWQGGVGYGSSVGNCEFIRGDANEDSNEEVVLVNVADVIFMLSNLFTGGPSPECFNAADVNDDEIFNIADPIFLLSYLFAMGPPPPLPFPDAGLDPTGNEAFFNLHLGEFLHEIYPILTDDNLGPALADSGFLDLTYTQTLELGENLEFQHINYASTPKFGVPINPGEEVYTYKLDFDNQMNLPSSVINGNNLDDFEFEEIRMMGDRYEIIDAKYFGNDLVRFDMAQIYVKDTISLGETGNYVIEDGSYEVSINSITDTQVNFNVNGESTDMLSLGSMYTLNSELHIVPTNIDSGEAEFVLSGKFVEIDDDQTVKINSQNINGLTTNIVSQVNGNTLSLSSISIEWMADEPIFVAENNDVAMPGFDVFRFSYGGFDASGVQEDLIVRNNGQEILEIVANIKDGVATIPILYGDLTSGYPGTFAVIGENPYKRLATTDGAILDYFDYVSSINYYSWVVISHLPDIPIEAESYLVTIKVGPNPDEGAVFTNVVTGETICTIYNINDDCVFDNFYLDVTGLVLAGPNREIILESTDPGTRFDKIYTKEGLEIQLPVDMVNGFNIGDETFDLNLKEEDLDGNIGQVEEFGAKLGFNSNDDTSVLEVSEPISGDGPFEIGDSDIYEAYVESPIGTRLLHDRTGLQYTLTAEYSGEESLGSIGLYQF